MHTDMLYTMRHRCSTDVTGVMSVSMSMSKTFIGGAVYREFESVQFTNLMCSVFFFKLVMVDIRKGAWLIGWSNQSRTGV